MKNLASIVFVLILGSAQVLLAAQKARIVSGEVDVYAAQDFDSEILETVRQNEVYWVSDKTYGPFYRIKLKSGRIGYIPDHELDIEGKGPFRPKPFIGEESASKKSNLKEPKSRVDQEIEVNEEMIEEWDDQAAFSFHSLSLNLINFHERTMDGTQVSDLYAVGYKRVRPDFIWGVMATLSPPKYYEQKTGGSATGFSVWGDFGANYYLPFTSRLMARISPGLTIRYSLVNLKTNIRSYDLQDLTLGVFFEGGLMVRVYKSYFEVSLRLNHEKNTYGGIGLALLF